MSAPNTSFSVTERVIVNPILYLRAPLLEDPDSPLTCRAKVWQFIESAIIARIVAIFTCIFAAVDAFVHLLTGLYKSGHLLLYKCCKVAPPQWNSSDICIHFKRAAIFGALAIVGTVAGTIWPDFFKSFPPPPPPSDSSLSIDNPPPDDNGGGGGGIDNNDGGDNFGGGGGSIGSGYDGGISSGLKDYGKRVARSIDDAVQLDAPPAVAHLQKQYSQGKASIDDLKRFWKSCNLNCKHWFVRVFNQETVSKVRTEMASTVYRPIQLRMDPLNVKWLNLREVTHQVFRIDTFAQAYYFHATPTLEGLKSILQSGVEVRHEKAYRGAFVSTEPETGFGKYILAFRRDDIERLSPLAKGFSIDDKYWAGFSRMIPVNAKTLAYIILDSNDLQERERLKAECKLWTNRDIKVILKTDVNPYNWKIKSLQMGIPKEWPDAGEDQGNKIVNAMKLAMPVAARAQVRQSVVEHTYDYAESSALQLQPLRASRSYARQERQQVMMMA